MKRALHLIVTVLALLLTTTMTASADQGWRGGGGGSYGYRGGGGGSYGYHGYGGGGPRYYGGAWGGPGYYGGAWVGPGWGAWGAWGPGWWWPPAYPYYVAPPVVIEKQPQTYIQSTPAPEEQAYWYYCQNPQGYYPYVKKCSTKWMKVVPSPDIPEDGNTAVPSPMVPNSKE